MPIAHVNGLNLHYESCGEGFPLILAHGYCASIEMWRRQIPAFSRRYRVIAYDARGHGLSTAPAGREHYQLGRLVDDLHGLMKQLDIDQAYLVGHSMGGATVAAYAHKYPEQVKATLICNIDGGHQPSDPQSEAASVEERRLKHDLVKHQGLADYARQQITAGAAPKFICSDPRESLAYIERYARQSVNGFLGVGEALPWRESWLAGATASLTTAVAIIAGTEDVMHIGAEALHRKLPQSRFVSITNAPHDSVNARPRAFESAVLDYLSALETGAPTAGRFSV